MGHGRYRRSDERAQFHVRSHLLIWPSLDRFSDEVSVYLAVNVLIIVQGLHDPFILSATIEPAFSSAADEAITTKGNEAGAATSLQTAPAL